MNVLAARLSAVRLFLHFVMASIRIQAQYRASALLLTFGQFSITIVEGVGVWALFDRFGAVQGWTFGEVATFYGLVNIMFCVADVLSRGFDVLGTEFLRTGDFDRLLLRPRSLALQLMGHDFRLSRIGRLATGLAMLVMGSRLAGVEWSFTDVAIALWAIAGGAALFFALIILQAASSFWTIESLEAGNVLTYGGVQAAQYPLSLYADWFRGVLTFVIPLSCVAYFPVLTVLDHPDPLGSPAWLGPVAPLAGFIFLVPSALLWRLGVRRYTSTGS